MAYIQKAVAQLMRDMGSCQSPQNAFLLNLGLETLHLRVPRHCENAQKVAEYLEKREEVAWVNYPGLPGNKYYELAKKYMPNGTSGVISFGLKGGREACVRFMDSLKLGAIVTHVADARTSVLHPASHTHRQLNDEQLAREYGGGLCIIFRLMPDNYHRYIYPDWGSKGGNTFIQGKLHTVRPVAQGKYSVYATNSREYTTLHTRNFGDVVFMEVGALMVGRICNHHGAHTFSRGEEKGYFEYGGSTIIMLLKKGVARLDREYQHCMNNGRETEVKLGMRIGTRAHA